MSWMLRTRIAPSTITTTETVLSDLNLMHVPRILVFNKIDLVTPGESRAACARPGEHPGVVCHGSGKYAAAAHAHGRGAGRTLEQSALTPSYDEGSVSEDIVDGESMATLDELLAATGRRTIPGCKRLGIFRSLLRRFHATAAGGGPMRDMTRQLIVAAWLCAGLVGMRGSDGSRRRGVQRGLLPGAAARLIESEVALADMSARERAQYALYRGLAHLALDEQPGPRSRGSGARRRCGIRIGRCSTPGTRAIVVKRGRRWARTGRNGVPLSVR